MYTQVHYYLCIEVAGVWEGNREVAGVWEGNRSLAGCFALIVVLRRPRYEVR